MTLQSALPRQATPDHQPSLIEEIVLEWILSGETLPRSPRRRLSRQLLERPRITLDDLGAEPDLTMDLRLAA